jgi:hypothetical protein
MVSYPRRNPGLAASLPHVTTTWALIPIYRVRRAGHHYRGLDQSITVVISRPDILPKYPFPITRCPRYRYNQGVQEHG